MFEARFEGLELLWEYSSRFYIQAINLQPCRLGGWAEPREHAREARTRERGHGREGALARSSARGGKNNFLFLVEIFLER